MKNAILISVVAGAALLVACASAPKRVESLEQARTDVQTLSQEPLAAEAASRELAAARSSLHAAEAALEKGDRDDVEHFSYVASRQAQTGQARVSEAEARKQVTQAEADRNRVLLEARTRDAEQATAQARSAQAEAQSAQAAAQSAQADAIAARAQAADMQKSLEELQAKQTERGMVLTLSDVLFDTGAATLKPGADLALGRVAQFMAQNTDTKVIIEGHADSRGSDSYNEDLSRRRAQAVRDTLASRGITGDRVEAIGRGEGFPVASNETRAGQQQNRRVEIIFSDQAGRFAQGVTGTMR